MHRDKAMRFFWMMLWLLATLVSLARVSFGAPAVPQKLSDAPGTTSNISQTVLKQIEHAFRKGSTAKRILKTLESVGGEVDLRELSKVLLAHVLASAGNGRGGTMSPKGEKLAISPEIGKILLESSGIDGMSSSEDILENIVVTVAPTTTRTQRQTKDFLQGLATQPVLPTSTATARLTEAAAATKRWLDASKKMDPITSTSKPRDESKDDLATSSPHSSNASLIVSNSDEEGQQEATSADADSTYMKSTDSEMEENEIVTQISQEFGGSNSTEFSPESISTTEAEVPESMLDIFVGAATANEPAKSHKTDADSEYSGGSQEKEEAAATTEQEPRVTSESTKTRTTEVEFLDDEEISRGQDGADFVRRTPFEEETKTTPTATIGSVSLSSDDETNSDVDDEPVTTAPPTSPTFESTDPDEEMSHEAPENDAAEWGASVAADSETMEPDDEVTSGVPERNTTKRGQARDGVLNASAEETVEAATSTQKSDRADDKESSGERMYSYGEAEEFSTEPSTSLADVPSVAEESIATSAPSVKTSPTEPNNSAMEESNSTTGASPSVGDSFMSEPEAYAETFATPTTSQIRSDTSVPSNLHPVTKATISVATKSSPSTVVSAGVPMEPHTTLKSISRFQDPLRLLLINKLGSDFARLAQVLRRPNLTDPLPDISAIVSEALASVRVQHLRSPTKRDVSEFHEALQLSVSGVRVNVNVTQQPSFIQHGSTTVNHVTIDRRRMYVLLHLHFRNVSVPLNVSVAADLFPPFFSVKRTNRVVHVEIGEVLVPLRIPFKLYFQKNEGEPATAGVLMPEDFVTHGASMLNVSTHFADCGGRDFMEKEVLRFDEHLKNLLELWLSHEPLTLLTDTLRSHLLVASRQPATMGLTSGVSEGTVVSEDSTPTIPESDTQRTTENSSPSNVEDSTPRVVEGSPPKIVTLGKSKIAKPVASTPSDQMEGNEDPFGEMDMYGIGGK